MSTKYKVLSNLNHDNTEYPVGSSIELEDNVADQLVADGVIESAEKPEPKPAPVASSRLDKNKKEKEEKKNDNKDEDKDDGLEALTMPKLVALAEKEEIELEDDLKKPEVVKIIRAARLAKADQGDEDKDDDTL